MSKDSAADANSGEGSGKSRQSGKGSSGKGAATGSAKKVGILGRLLAGGFLSGAVDELKKVVHPTRQEALQATVVTLIFMSFFGIILGLLDWALRSVIWQLL